MASKFTGGVFAHFFYKIAVCLVTVLTLGLCYPCIACGYWRWEANHTRINGLQMKFSGKASALFKKYIVWWALCIITLGVYYVLKIHCDIMKWKTQNVHAEGRKERSSYFKAEWHQLLRVRISCVFMTVITLGIGYSWAHCAFSEWVSQRTYIDGNSLDFVGDGKEFLKNYALWCLLSIITLGVYEFWLSANIVRWDTQQTEFKFKEDVAAGKTVLITRPLPVLPQPVVAVEKPAMGERFKRVYEFMKVKRAMICFALEILFLVLVTLLLAFTAGKWTFLVTPLLLWAIVLFSLPAIFIAEERFSDIGGIKLQSAKAWSIAGLIFSAAIPLFTPVFIYGLIETLRLKKWIYGTGKVAEDTPLTENGEAIIPEQEAYFEAVKNYQIYIWDCGNYKKAVRNYARETVEYDERLKACNVVLESLGKPMVT